MPSVLLILCYLSIFTTVSYVSSLGKSGEPTAPLPVFYTTMEKALENSEINYMTFSMDYFNKTILEWNIRKMRDFPRMPTHRLELLYALLENPKAPQYGDDFYGFCSQTMYHCRNGYWKQMLEVTQVMAAIRRKGEALAKSVDQNDQRALSALNEQFNAYREMNFYATEECSEEFKKCLNKAEPYYGKISDRLSKLLKVNYPVGYMRLLLSELLVMHLMEDFRKQFLIQAKQAKVTLHADDVRPLLKNYLPSIYWKPLFEQSVERRPRPKPELEPEPQPQLQPQLQPQGLPRRRPPPEPRPYYYPDKRPRVHF